MTALTAGYGPAATYGDGHGAGVEATLARLEGAEEAVLLPSGVSAAATALTALTNPGGHVIASAHLGGPLRDWLEGDFPRSGRTVDFVDCTDPEEVAAAVRPQTQLVHAESLTDPTMRLCPVNELSALAHTEDLILLVDNTGLSPGAHRPLDAGASVVVEDCGPLLDGHGGLCAGVVAGPGRLLAPVRAQARMTGAVADPACRALLARGLLTLPLRLAAQQQHADRVAQRLRDLPAVTAVHRPDHAAAPWARETHEGFGALLSFTPAAGPQAARRLVAALHSLGLADEAGTGLRTGARLPALTTHGHWSERRRAAAGISRAMIRLDIGVEDPDPLLAAVQRILTEGEPC